MSAVILAATLFDLISLALFGNGVDAFTWWANALVFFASLTFLSVNVANIFYFRRHARARYNAVNNLLIPLAGVAFNAYLLYAAFFAALWSSDWRTGKSVVVISCALFFAEIIVVLYIRIRHAHRLTGAAPLGTDDPSTPGLGCITRELPESAQYGT